jgi:hypothetical protein
VSRVDLPTLMCDRCKIKTTDPYDMGKFTRIYRDGVSDVKEWDLCKYCWDDFNKFISDTPAMRGQ